MPSILKIDLGNYTHISSLSSCHCHHHFVFLFAGYQIYQQPLTRKHAPARTLVLQQLNWALTKKYRHALNSSLLYELHEQWHFSDARGLINAKGKTGKGKRRRDHTLPENSRHLDTLDTVLTP